MYSQEVAAAICARLAEGMSLRAVCRQDGMPAASTVLAWLEDEDKKDFAEQYACARARGYQLLGDEIVEISDEEVTMVRRSKHGRIGDDEEDGEVEVVFDPTAVARNRLRVDARKWMLSKMLPKVYGDKLTQEHTGPNGGPLQIASIAVELVRPSITESPKTPGSDQAAQAPVSRE